MSEFEIKDLFSSQLLGKSFFRPENGLRRGNCAYRLSYWKESVASRESIIKYVYLRFEKAVEALCRPPWLFPNITH